MVYTLALLIPIAIVLTLFIMLDFFSLIDKRRLITACLYGAALSAVILVIDRLLPDLFPEESLWFRWGDELLKSLLIVWMLKKARTYFMLDTAAYAASIGLGYCLVECLGAIGSETLVTSLWITKAFGIYFAQTLATVLTALILLGLKSVSMLGLFVLAPLPAVLILHWAAQMDVVTSIFMLFSFSLIGFKWIADFEVYMIARKMDSELSSEVTLLQAINGGTFANTPAGEYLVSLREHFAPEVYLDMICCVRLSVEMSLWRKSDRLLKMTGFTQMHTQDVAQARTEFIVLYDKIGTAARQYLRPLLNRGNLKDII